MSDIELILEGSDVTFSRKEIAKKACVSLCIKEVSFMTTRRSMSWKVNCE